MSDLEMREGVYGDKILAVEPGGIEAIPDEDRHGKASQLFATWMSPNLEFATIYVGALGVIAFGLSFWQAVLGIVIGNALGSAGQYVLTKDGPKYGVPQMVIGRAAFGKLGNILPSIFNAGAAGIGWFAVNSVSGAFALANLTKMTPVTSLVIVVIIQVAIAFVGHNLVQTVEKYLFPYLIVVFGIAAVYTFTNSKTHLGAHGAGHTPGGFLILIGAVYGYAAGWNPFSADYARYLPKSVDGKKAGRSAGFGIFISATTLQIVGAAAGTAGLHLFDTGNPTSDFTGLMPNILGKLVLLGIVGGSICANVLNIYSGAMSFLTIGIKVGSHLRRGISAIVFGIAGFLLAKAAIGNPANNYENFLLIMSYWIGPWLGVILADKMLRKGASIERLLFANRENIAGPIAFVVGTVFSIWGFVNQTWGHGKSFHFVSGYFVKKNGNLGDITFLVGFAVAFVIYYLIAKKKVSAEK
jgi:NCS1 family nucleobase:cation symporter-1